MKITQYQVSTNSIDSNAELFMDGAEKWRARASINPIVVGPQETKADAQRAIAAALRALADKVESDE
jgi:hypothetical protein